MLPEPNQILLEMSPLNIRITDFRSTADLVLIETASREFLRLKQFYQFLADSGFMTEAYDTLFIRLGKRGLQDFLTKTLSDNYAQLEGRWF